MNVAKYYFQEFTVDNLDSKPQEYLIYNIQYDKFFTQDYSDQTYRNKSFFPLDGITENLQTTDMKNCLRTK